MSELTETIELTYVDRDLILKHGYLYERLNRSLKRWPKQQAVRKVKMSHDELKMLIGELCRSISRREAGDKGDLLLDLCERLEYAERTGDGDHPGIMR